MKTISLKPGTKFSGFSCARVPGLPAAPKPPANNRPMAMNSTTQMPMVKPEAEKATPLVI